MDNAYNNIITINKLHNSGGSGCTVINYSSNNTITLNMLNNNNSGLFVYNSHGNIFPTVIARNNAGYGVDFSSGDNVINNLTTSNSGSTSIRHITGDNYILNYNYTDSVFSVGVEFSNSRLKIKSLNGSSNPCIKAYDYSIEREDSDMSNGSGSQWKLNIESTNTSLIDNYPVVLSLAKIAVSANNLVTVSVWCRKGDATTVGARLVCRGGQIAGVTSDVYDTKVDDTDEEQLTITFTPTEDGVVEIEGWGYCVSNTSYVVFDTLTVTQA
jgi:hypothetical protein